MWEWIKSTAALVWEGIKNCTLWVGTKVGLISCLPTTSRTTTIPSSSTAASSVTYSKLTNNRFVRNDADTILLNVPAGKKYITTQTPSTQSSQKVGFAGITPTIYCAMKLESEN